MLLFRRANALHIQTRPGALERVLRGFPLCYQSGDRRALFPAEERTSTDLFLWPLFRVGAAACMDLGRAWGGNNVNTLAPGWLANAGIGLRIVSARAAFSNVMHVDLAFPIDADVAVKKVQFLVKTRTSFWSAARGTRIAAMRSSMVRSDPLHRQAATRRQTTRDRIQRSPS